MTTKTTFTATAPDGSLHTRTSAATYTHAVLCGPDESTPFWGPWSFHTTRTLAEKAAIVAGRCYAEVVVVEVTA